MEKRKKDNSPKTYNDLLMLLESDDNAKKDVYSNLMDQEKEVLRTLSLASNILKDKKIVTNMFLNMSLADLMAKFAFTWQNIFNELIIEKQFTILPMVLFKQERKIYVGIMLIIISCFLFVASIN